MLSTRRVFREPPRSTRLNFIIPSPPPSRPRERDPAPSSSCRGKQSWPYPRCGIFQRRRRRRGRGRSLFRHGNKVSPRLFSDVHHRTRRERMSFLLLSSPLSLRFLFLSLPIPAYTEKRCTYGCCSDSRRVSSQPLLDVYSRPARLALRSGRFVFFLSLAHATSFRLSLFSLSLAVSSVPSNVSALRLLSSVCLSGGGNE